MFIFGRLQEEYFAEENKLHMCCDVQDNFFEIILRLVMEWAMCNNVILVVSDSAAMMYNGGNILFRTDSEWS